MITYDQYKAVDIRAGKVLSAVPVEKSEKLLLLSVDFGEEKPRTVVSGIAKHFPDLTQLVGITCGFVCHRLLLG